MIAKPNRTRKLLPVVIFAQYIEKEITKFYTKRLKYKGQCVGGTTVKLIIFIKCVIYGETWLHHTLNSISIPFTQSVINI